MSRASAARRAARRAERLVHDLADRAGATSALRAAAETAVNLARGAQRGGRDRMAHLVVAEHVAGADDHMESPGALVASATHSDCADNFGLAPSQIYSQFKTILSY